MNTYFHFILISIDNFQSIDTIKENYSCIAPRKLCSNQTTRRQSIRNIGLFVTLTWFNFNFIFFQDKWLREHFEIDHEADAMAKLELFNSYQEFCKKNNQPNVGRSSFYAQVEKLYPMFNSYALKLSMKKAAH